MAIYWVDPYINSAAGGIHGTTDTTTRNGTYASPWNLVDITTAAKLTGLASGDEVRFKGLAESTFFPTQETYSSVTGTGASTTYYYLQTGNNSKLIRVKDIKGVVYYNAISPSYNYLRTILGTTTWQNASPLMDTTYGYYPMSETYVITSGPGANVVQFPSLAVPITITSGWTSETVRDGVTIIYPKASTAYGTSVYFGNSTAASYKFINWDCPEMIIGFGYSTYVYLYGNSMNFKSLCHGNYQPGYSWNIYCGAQSTPYQTNQANFTCGSMSTGGYFNIYDYAGSTTPTINIAHTTAGYSRPYIYVYKGTNTETTLTMKHVYSYYQWQVVYSSGGAYTLNINFDTDYHVEARYNTFDVTSFTTLNENFATTQYTTAMFSSTIFNQFGGVVASPSANISPPSAQDYTYYSNTTSKFKKLSFAPTSTYKSFVRKFLIETGETLETLTASPAASNASSAYGAPAKLQIMSEISSGEKVQFMTPTTAGDVAIIYNNSNYSNKMAWKLFGTGNGLVYADTFSLPLVSFGANGATFNASFTTTASPGITLLVKLYGINKTTGAVTNIKNATTTVNGTAITATASFTNTELTTTYNVGSMFAIVDITKTSTATCDVIFNSMSLTSP